MTGVVLYLTSKVGSLFFVIDKLHIISVGVRDFVYCGRLG